MKINKYQIYLLLFFIIFLSADACFIFMANNTYEKKLPFNNLKNTTTKVINHTQSNDEALPSFFKINITPFNNKNDFIISLEMNKKINFKRLAIQIYNVENKKIVKNFVFDFTEQNLYKTKFNSSDYNRWVLKVNLVDHLNHHYFSAYRMIFDKTNYKVIQIN
ncbi:MAG: hypothetical protein AB8B46_05260 [Candidatus Midichloriaceae bacterium]